MLCPIRDFRTGLFMEVGFVLAERILYIPSMGFCFLASSLASQFSGVGGFKWRSQIGFLCAAVIAAYSIKTYDRNFDWMSETPLYKTGIAIAPNNAKLHHNYAHSITDDVSRKEFHLREAIRLYPPYISAYINLGVRQLRHYFDPFFFPRLSQLHPTPHAL